MSSCFLLFFVLVPFLKAKQLSKLHNISDFPIQFRTHSAYINLTSDNEMRLLVMFRDYSTFTTQSREVVPTLQYTMTHPVKTSMNVHKMAVLITYRVHQTFPNTPLLFTALLF